MANWLTFFLLLSISFSVVAASTSRRTNFLNAQEILSASGYLSMALTLEITSNVLNLESSACTIFAPSDLAFVQLGQPSLLQLLYHISPLRLSIYDLNNIPLGSRIPTLLQNQSLIVTSSFDLGGHVSVNGVLVQESALLVDYGSIVLYGINKFFNFSYEISSSVPGVASASQSQESHVFDVGIESLFRQASDLLMSSGYSIMSAFLDVQLCGFMNNTRLTIFAPVDAAMEAYSKNISDFSKIFRQHVAPGLLSWQDLVTLKDRTSLQSFSGGFLINVTTSGDILILNGAPVVFPDLYSSDWLIVHGLDRLLVSTVKQELVGDLFSDFDWEKGSNHPDYGEYGYGTP